MEYEEDHGHENYVPNFPKGVQFREDHYKEVFVKQEEEENQEYRILDISESAHSFRPTEEDSLNNHAEQEESNDSADDEDDEGRGVLKHTWADEDPNDESDKEDETNSKLKALMSSLVKFINFLNKLLEDNQNFISSDIKDKKSIDEHKQAVAINAHMIADLAKTNIESNYAHVNEIVPELKKLLAVKVDIFDKLYDRLAHGVISSEVVKRLFSGNNLLIKSQIEELRRILFAKLELVNKTHSANVQKLKALKRAKRLAAKPKVQVFKKKKPPKVAPVPAPVGNINKLETQSREAVDTLEDKINTTLQTIQKNKAVLQDQLNQLHKLQDIEIDKLIKIEIPDREVDELPESDYSKPEDEGFALNDFHSFTQVVSKKLNLKPEEASPSSILSKFRTNLNKKLQKDGERSYIPNGTKVSVIEVNLDDLREEDFIVEEVFFEDICPDEVDESLMRCDAEGHVKIENDPDDASYTIQDISYNKPELSTYNINDITLTKVPVATDSSRPHVIEDPVPSSPSNILHQLGIEKTLLKDRPKALLQLQELVKHPVEKSKEKRDALRRHLEQRVAELEYKAVLAKEYLLDLDKKRNKKVKTLPSKPRPRRTSPGKFAARDRARDFGIPYLLTPGFVQAEPLEVKQEPGHENPFNSSVDEKLKSLFQNNNLKGNLMKTKFMKGDTELTSYKKRKEDELCHHETEADVTLENTTNTKVLDKQKLCDAIRKLDSTNRPASKTSSKAVVKKPTMSVVHDVTVPRKLNGKRECKKALVLPGPRNKIFSLIKKANPPKQHWLERGDGKRCGDVKNAARMKEADVEEFNNSKSKRLLEKLKMQIFEKLHQQDEARRGVDVRQEIERRLRKREKTRGQWM